MKYVKYKLKGKIKMKIENENHNQISKSKTKMKIKNRILISIFYFNFILAFLSASMLDSNGIFLILSYILLTISSAWCIVFLTINHKYFTEGKY